MSVLLYVFFFFKQKTAYEMRISDWSSDVCSSDLRGRQIDHRDRARRLPIAREREGKREILARLGRRAPFTRGGHEHLQRCLGIARERKREAAIGGGDPRGMTVPRRADGGPIGRQRVVQGKDGVCRVICGGSRNNKKKK